MTRRRLFALFLLLALGCFANARAETEVKMTGDMRMYGEFHQNRNFTGYNAASWSANSPSSITKSGTRAEEQFQVWERFRLRADFVANEAVKFRLGLRVENTWGRGTYTAANPAAAVEVYMAYLQFKWPNSDVEITAGLHQFDLPQSSMFFNSPVFGGERITGLSVKIPLLDDKLNVIASYLRLYDANQTYDTTSTQYCDEFDAYALALPITLDGFKVTPWAMATMAGKYASYWNTYMGPNQVGAYMAAPAALDSAAGWKNNQNGYYWIGSAFEVSALDPVRFYADVTYSSGAMNDAQRFRRQGWMADIGIEYTGWTFATPQVFAWYGSGEDDSIRNGSERMALIKPNWGAGNSWLFDTDMDFAKGGAQGTCQVPVGNWGIGFSLQKISLIEKLTHRFTVTFVQGTNSAKAIRTLNNQAGDNPYFVMGRDLTVNEHVLGINFDHKYKLYENLDLVVESGWASGLGSFQESVWGHTLTKRSLDNCGEWKVAFGFMYRY